MQKPIKAAESAPKATLSIYPEPFYSMIKGRQKRALGDIFGISSFGVNLTILEPKAISALFHEHSVSQEFIYILEGTATVKFGLESFQMQTGDCMGFMPNQGAHQLLNLSDSKVVYLEIGDRLPGDAATYPNDDIAADFKDGAWKLSHKDGSPY